MLRLHDPLPTAGRVVVVGYRYTGIFAVPPFGHSVDVGRVTHDPVHLHRNPWGIVRFGVPLFVAQESGTVPPVSQMTPTTVYINRNKGRVAAFLTQGFFKSRGCLYVRYNCTRGERSDYRYSFMADGS